MVLLKWLKQGYIDTLDLPEAYKEGSLFLDLLQAVCMEEASEEMPIKQRENNDKPPVKGKV